MASGGKMGLGYFFLSPNFLSSYPMGKRWERGGKEVRKAETTQEKFSRLRITQKQNSNI